MVGDAVVEWDLASEPAVRVAGLAFDPEEAGAVEVDGLGGLVSEEGGGGGGTRQVW